MDKKTKNTFGIKVKKGFVFSIIIFWILVMSSLVTPVLAQGIFDMECPRCDGKGFIVNISRTSLNYEGVYHGLDYYLRITATFYNEGPEGAYKTVISWVKYRGDIYDEQQGTWYFPPKTYTTTVLDVDASFWTTETGTYTMYVEDPYDICPNCQGSGYVTNWVMVTTLIVAVIVVGAVIGISAYVVRRVKKTKLEVS